MLSASLSARAVHSDQWAAAAFNIFQRVNRYVHFHAGSGKQVVILRVSFHESKIS